LVALETWKFLLKQLWLGPGPLLVCIGLVLSASTLLEKGLWAVVAVYYSYGWWANRGAVNVTEAVIQCNYLKSVPITPVTNSTLAKKIGLVTLGKWLEQTRLFWVALSLPALLWFEGRYLLVGIVALTIGWTVTGLLSGSWGRALPLNWSLYLLVILIPLSLVASAFPATSREFLGYLLAQFVALYTVATWANNAKRLYLLAWCFIGIELVLAILTPLIIRKQGGQFPLLNQVVQLLSILPIVQKNIIGGTLVVLLPLNLGLLLSQNKGRLYKVRLGISIAALLLTLVAIALSESRSAYLATIIVSVGFVVFCLPPKYRWSILAAILLLLVISIASIGFANISTVLDFVTQSNTFRGIDGRIEVWLRGIFLLQDFPLTGSGIGNYAHLAPILYPFLLSQLIETHAHNIFLQVGVDLGFPGIICFTAILLTVIKAGFAGWNSWKGDASTKMKYLVLGGLWSVVALLLDGMLDAVTWATKPAFISWAVLGWLLVSNMAVESKRNLDPAAVV
jgi:O-antigen ligase